MNPILENVFGTDSSLTEHPMTSRQEQELFEELAKAAAEMNHVQASPEHRRVMRLIQEKMRGQTGQSPE